MPSPLHGRTRPTIRTGASAGAITALALFAAGCGGSTHDTAQGHAGASGGGRTVDVTMVDVAYQPTQLAVGRGETVTFRFRNDGVAVHEALIADEAGQMAHHGEMAPGSSMTMDDDHGSGDVHGAGTSVVTVQPGATEELTHTFAEGGTMWIGCHVPGHWEAGMKLRVDVG
jgi:uncharacterized cupredoxin-like copper-binding protein